MGDGDFAGLQAVLIHDVLLGGENEPDGFVVERSLLIIGVLIVVADQGLLGRGLFLRFLVRLDMAQQRGRGFDNLSTISRCAGFSGGNCDKPGVCPVDTVIQ